jgi:hypothetical protein
VQCWQITTIIASSPPDDASDHPALKSLTGHHWPCFDVTHSMQPENVECDLLAVEQNFIWHMPGQTRVCKSLESGTVWGPSKSLESLPVEHMLCNSTQVLSDQKTKGFW